ncbi:calcium-activated potassium channel subunit beta-4-like [Nerophis ophidion]|uniref:calcium-activated potassium channel subunit beta-4-like n=1 Tax=Nerophis ophidion TaxID=159077 RepID=UPI002ADFC606|nr:calcium-activated potassium channel subunit beta-4-like [Nerophis ophidion]
MPGRRVCVAAMAKARVSLEFSEAEDRSIRLGLFLMACGVLSLFILGFCWISPALHSLNSKSANCTVVSVLRPEETFACVFTCGAACKGTSSYPCLQVFVNNSESSTLALLHFDEQQLVLNPKVQPTFHQPLGKVSASVTFKVRGWRCWAAMTLLCRCCNRVNIEEDGARHPCCSVAIVTG